MNRRNRERYLTKDQADKLRPLLLAAVAKVSLRMSQARAEYEGSDRDKEVLYQAAQAFRMDMNEEVRRVLALRTTRHLPI